MKGLAPHQKINHFPGMNNIYRKNLLARNLNKMRRSLPDLFDFYPQTWILPVEHNDFISHFKSKLKRENYKLMKKKKREFLRMTMAQRKEYLRKSKIELQCN